MFESLRDQIRKRCDRTPAGRQVWSRAVGYARIQGVVMKGEKGAFGDEVNLKVCIPDERMTRNVTLDLEDGDEDFDCDCPSTQPVCIHVATAAIAYGLSLKDGVPLPSPEDASGYMEYDLERRNGGLSLTRVLVHRGERKVMETTLTALVSGRVPGPPVTTCSADLNIDRIINLENRQVPGREKLEALLPLLAACPTGHVTLDGKPVSIATEGADKAVVQVDDAPGGYRVQAVRNPLVAESFDNGCLLVRKSPDSTGEDLALALARRHDLNAREREDLVRGRFFAFSEKVALFSDYLPGLRRRIPVTVAAKHAPRRSDAKPRVLMDCSVQDGTLVVRPSIVYGDPMVAKVEGGRLVSTSGVIPDRNETEEERLAREVEKVLRLPLGIPSSFRNPEHAIEISNRIKAWLSGGGARGTPSPRPAEGLSPGARGKPVEPTRTVRGASALDAFRMSATPLSASFDALDGSFDFSLMFSAGKASASPKSVFEAFRNGDRHVRLTDGTYAPIPAEWMARYGARVMALVQARERNGGELPGSLVPEVAKVCRAMERPVPPAFQGLEAMVEDFDGLPPLPEGMELSTTLRGYQSDGVRWLLFLKNNASVLGGGALLADDMGLGKTLQTIAVLEGPSLVVAPTSVIHNWKAEIARFRPGLSTCLYYGPKRRLDEDAQVVLTTYALLRSDIQTLASRKWKVVVLDEAQAIKNKDSQTARSAFALKADFRIALTGTPVENRLDELWSELAFATPGLLGTLDEFRDRFAKPMEEGSLVAAAALREKIHPFVLRRLKADVAGDLPARTETVHRFELSEGEMGLYALVHQTAKQAAGKGDMATILSGLLRMRQACCHPSLVPGGEAVGESTKLGVLMGMLKELAADGHRALVFSQWTSFLDLMEPALAQSGIGFLRLDGSTRDRQSVVDAFQSPDGPLVMIVSLKAGGTGLNLTAADHVFLTDLWWNPAAEDQAADRTHRIGQTRPVFVHRLVAMGTVEEKILELQREKRSLADAALAGSSGAAGLTRDDLMALLKD